MTNALMGMEKSVKGTSVRLYILDVLRLGAAISVVFYHLVAASTLGSKGATNPPMEPVVAVSAYGALGVQFFFMVSGFVILMSLWGRSLASFTASRISRLFPAYWTAVILCTFLFLVIAPGQFKTPSLTQILVNLTMLQEGLGVKHIDGVYWTLWVELIFYVTAALLATRGLTATRVLAFAFIWPLFGAMAVAAKQDFLIKLLIPNHAPYFALGMVMYLVFAEGPTMLRWISIGMNLILGGYMTITHSLPAMERITGRDLSATVVWGLLAFGVLLLAAATISPLSSWGFAWMSIAGALTYPLYLVHEYWGWWIIESLHGRVDDWVVLALALASVTVLAWSIYRLVEVPFAKKFRKALEKGFVAYRSPETQGVQTPHLKAGQ